MLDQKAIRQSDNPEAERYVQAFECFVEASRKCFEQGVRRGEDFILPVHAVRDMVGQVEGLMREFSE